tara:strand:+ start:1231 stop:2268 length:1038 start_codon:yes stop_codon:yes gene_type:complete
VSNFIFAVSSVNQFASFMGRRSKSQRRGASLFDVNDMALFDGENDGAPEPRIRGKQRAPQRATVVEEVDAAAAAESEHLMRRFGVKMDAPRPTKRLKAAGAGEVVVTIPADASVDDMKRLRDAARARKDWMTADALREELQRRGVTCQDVVIGATSAAAVKKKEAKLMRESIKKEKRKTAKKKAAAKKKKELGKIAAKIQKLPMGIEIEDIRVGSGVPVVERKRVRVKCVGVALALVAAVYILARVLLQTHSLTPLFTSLLSHSYVGRLEHAKGTIFDRSQANHPFSFKLGKGDVIKGWDIGILGMKVGGERRITVPPKAGYGMKKMAGIPPNSTLVFDVTVVGI